MLKNWEYQLPTEVRFGRGGLRHLGTIAEKMGDCALLVGYEDQTGLEEVYQQAQELLRQAGLFVDTYFGVPPDPSADVGPAGAHEAQLAGAQVIVGLGGGSVLDAAKGIAVLARMPGTLWDYTTANPDHQPITEAVPIIAVPTTAGTGSEVTPVAVFSHHGVASDPDVPLKASISSPLIRPRVALVDPSLTVGSPARLTAACGADALGHAIEAYISRRANPFASVLAARAVRLIVKNLAAAVAHPDDPEPREALSLGSVMAGAAFGSAGVVMTHAIAQAMGSLLHLPHGQAVALATPTNLRYNLPEAESPYCELAHYCGVAADAPEARAEQFVEHIVQLLRSVDVPDRVRVAERVETSEGQPGWDSLDDLADKLARNAFESTPVPLTLNPRRVDHATLKQLIRDLLEPAT